MANRASRPIDERLFTWPAENPALLGSRCQDCGQMAFPVQENCRACSSDDVAIEELPGRGTLWTWTVQRFMPKPPYNNNTTLETFQPYGVGYVELPNGVRVAGRLLENDPDKLAIDMAMEVVFETYRTEKDGTDVIGFAFKPVES